MHGAKLRTLVAMAIVIAFVSAMFAGTSGIRAEDAPEETATPTEIVTETVTPEEPTEIPTTEPTEPPLHPLMKKYPALFPDFMTACLICDGSIIIRDVVSTLDFSTQWRIFIVIITFWNQQLLVG